MALIAHRYFQNEQVKAYREIKLSQLPQEILQLGAILAFLQIADGFLTALGVLHFGTHAEGNQILRLLMQQWGEIPTLLFIKSFAILMIGILCKLSSFVIWVETALKAAIYFYISAAVLPWCLMITIKHLL